MTICINKKQVIPVSLRQHPQWVCWRYETRNGKRTKVPYSPITGGRASTNNPGTWGAYEDAAVTLEMGFGDDEDSLLRFNGIGFVFSKNDTLCGIDLDGCVKDGVIDTAAQELIDSFGSYTELSPSGNGVHIICRGKLPGKGRKDISRGIEIYDQGRYFTITGQTVQFSEIKSCQAQIDTLLGTMPDTVEASHVDWDNQCSAKAAEALAVFRTHESNGYLKLFEGDISEYNGDESSADLALCNKLAFYCAKDAKLIDECFRQSELMRPKWDRTDYKRRTIGKAIANCGEVFNWDAYQRAQEAVRNDGLARQALRATPRDGAANRPGRHVLRYSDPLHAAELFVAENYPSGELLSACDRWFEWDGTKYTELDEAIIKRRILYWLRNQQARTKDGILSYNATTAKLNDVLSMVKLAVTPERNIDFPCWRNPNGMPDPQNMMAFRNGLLDLGTLGNGELIDHTPVWLSLNCVPYDYDPRAKCSLWLNALSKIFKDDPESIETLQKWMGYCLSNDMSHQKFVLLVGPPGSGKSTILNTISNLLGRENCCNPTLGRLENNFGLYGFIGKKLAVFPDAHLNRARSAVDVVEKIKSITGNDALDIDRKHKDPLTSVRLNCKLMMAANKMPRLPDSASGLMRRVIVLKAPNKLAEQGAVDLKMEDKLENELPGIANWAIKGHGKLQADGDLGQPTSAGDLLELFQDLQSPIGAFIREWCRVGDKCKQPTSDVYDVYRQWCDGNGLNSQSKINFGSELASLGYKNQPTSYDGKRCRCYFGLELNAKGRTVLNRTWP